LCAGKPVNYLVVVMATVHEIRPYMYRRASQ